MNDGKLPTWFWVIAGIAVVWNFMGIAAYYSDVTLSPEALAELPQAQQDMRAATPGWLTGVYAIAVFAGFAAAISLVVKRIIAVPLFAVSLVAIVIQMSYVFFVMNAPEVLGAAATTLPIVLIVLGSLQLWFSVHAKGRDWLK